MQNAMNASEKVYLFFITDNAKAKMFRLRGFAASLNMTNKPPAFSLRRVLLWWERAIMPGMALPRVRPQNSPGFNRTF